jgi:hypothetical protein
MVEQVSDDLAPFSSGIKKEALDQLIAESGPSNRYSLARFVIKEGKLEVPYAKGIEKARRFRTIKRSLETLCKTFKMTDCDFIATIEDASPLVSPPCPLFAFAKRKDRDQNIVLLPDDGALRGNTSWLSKVQEGKRRYPWRRKEARLFWRGSTTGDAAAFQTLPRFKLVSLSIQFPELVDARFNHLVQTGQELERYKGETVSVADHLKYKYQLLIDGNTCAYTRAFWQLHADCLIFKPDSENIQWFYRALAKDIHYVAVQADMSDLLEKIEWARTHDLEAQRIVKNANLFAQNNLQIEDVHLYLYLLLESIGRLDR